MSLRLPHGQCPCGSGLLYAACCGPLHDGARATTAEAVMRARYAANVLGRSDYLFRSWHPRTRPEHVDAAPGLTWNRLQVLRTVDGQEEDDTGVVEFEAAYDAGSEPGVLHETSRFERRSGTWVYVDGVPFRAHGR